MTMESVRTFLYLILALAVGCCPKPKPPEPLPVRKEVCLEKKPPELLPWKPIGRSEGCPEPYAACLTAEDANALATNYENLIRYVQEAWKLCGNVE